MWRMLAPVLAGLTAMMAFTTTSFAKETVQQRIDELIPGAELLLPDGPGPHPVVIQMHGCGGKKLLQGRYAPDAVKAGWAVLIIDSYAHRGISTLEAYATVCTGMQLWGKERAGDLYAMMEWVRHQSWADPTHIVAAGWSHGGWSVLDALALTPGKEMADATRLDGLPAEPLAGLVGAFVIYPYQGFGAVAPGKGLRVDVPVKALVGTADAVVGGYSLEKTLTKMRKPGAPIDITMMEGATHAFDEKEAQDWRVKYSPELTEKAHTMYADFLRAAAGRSPQIKPR